MEFYLIDTKKEMSVTLRAWENGQWGPNFFGDMETGFASGRERVKGSDAIICTSGDYNAMVSYWIEEVWLVNNGHTSDPLGSKEGHSEDYELDLSTDLTDEYDLDEDGYAE